MPRRPRTNYPGAITHVTARGNRREPIYFDDRGYRTFLAVLEAVSRRRGWRCHAYCLMPNHYQAVIETPHGDLSTGMQYLNSRYAEWFNRRSRLTGTSSRVASTPSSLAATGIFSSSRDTSR